jgi:hypothetical protein
MKPLNTKERNSTFWSFALFFALSIILIITVIYFSFAIPQKQYAALKNMVKDYDSFMAKQRGFMSQLDTINLELKQYNMPMANQSYLQNDISKKTIVVEDAIGEENETNKVYHRIVDNYKKMLSYKSKLNDAKIQLTQANAALDDCDQDNRKVEKELKDKQEKK